MRYASQSHELLKLRTVNSNFARLLYYEHCRRAFHQQARAGLKFFGSSECILNWIGLFSNVSTDEKVDTAGMHRWLGQ